MLFSATRYFSSVTKLQGPFHEMANEISQVFFCPGLQAKSEQINAGNNFFTEQFNYTEQITCKATGQQGISENKKLYFGCEKGRVKEPQVNSSSLLLLFE